MPTKDDLRYFQVMPLDIKIGLTRNRIREWVSYYGEDGVYVSFSGGKDSTVLLHIVREMYPDIEAVFVNTGLEYPEIQKFVKTFDNVTILRPKMRFDEVLKTKGYPILSKEISNTVRGARESIKKGVYSLRLCQLGVEQDEYGGLIDSGKYDYKTAIKNSKFLKIKYKPLVDADFLISEQCCDVMKKAPLKKFEKQTGKVPILATMAEESMSRETAWLKNGCNAFDSKDAKSTPMSFWTEQDVLQYIKQYNLPIASVYGDVVYAEQPDQLRFDGCEGGKLKTTGADRTGCIFCGFGCHVEPEPGRFKRTKGTHPRQYEYCIGGGEYVYKAFKRDIDGKWEETAFPYEYEDGTLMTEQEIERFAEIHTVGFAGYKEEDMFFKVEKYWQPSKEGLGMGHVFDELNKIYGEGFIKY